MTGHVPGQANCTLLGKLMRYFLPFITLIALAGCAGSPPKPPSCNGEFKPVNGAQLGTALSSEMSAALCTGSDNDRG